MFQIQPYPKLIQKHLVHGQVWVSSVPNLTILQTNHVNLGHGQVWYYISETHDPNVSMLIWNMVGFRLIECIKSDHVPNLIWDIPSWIWDMITFRTSNIPNRKLKS